MATTSRFVTRLEAAEQALHTILEAGSDLIEALSPPERIIAKRVRKEMEGRR